MLKWVMKAHRWMSLIFAGFWLLQAVTGTLISFRGNIDDFALGAEVTSIIPEKLGARIDALQSDGATVWSMWSSGGVQGQFDIYYTKDDTDYTLRVNGEGEDLRHRPDSNLYSDGALFETLTQFHKNMFLGALGYIIFSVSAVLLITNIVFGFVYGWKHRKKLNHLAKVGKAGSVAKLKGLHWEIGLWGAPLAIVLVTFGFLLSNSDVVDSWVAADLPETTVAQSSEGRTINSGEALEVVSSLYDLETLSAFKPKNAHRDYFEVRVKAPSEMPRLYGASTVRIGGDGQVLLNKNASKAGAGQQFANALYPAHTGQILGLPGRVLNFMVGIWLLVMMFLGLSSWFKRKAN